MLRFLKVAFLALVVAGIFQADAWAQATSGKVTTSAPTYTNNTLGALSLDTNGNLRVLTSTGGSGAANVVSAQVSVAASATQIVAVRAGRHAVTIVNTGTTPVYLGPAGVTTATGTLLPGIVGASVTLDTSAAIFGIASVGTQTVTDFETF